MPRRRSPRIRRPAGRPRWRHTLVGRDPCVLAPPDDSTSRIRRLSTRHRVRSHATVGAGADPGRGRRAMSGKRTVIAGGTVATDSAVLAADLVIEDGRIAALTEPGAAGGCDELIDASGLVVMPGAIDPHAQFEDPGATEREDVTTGTMAAAAGGITTVIEHPLTYPPVTTTELYREKRELASRKVGVDFGLWGALTPTSLGEIAGQRAEGAMGFKAFMPHSDPSYPHVTDAEFLDGM